MEHIHGVDVSWMTHGNPKDKATKTVTRPRTTSQTTRESPSTAAREPQTPPRLLSSNASPVDQIPGRSATSSSNTAATPPRPAIVGGGSEEKKSSTNPPPTLHRRNSWFSNLSSKFSSPNAVQSPPQANKTPPKPAEMSVPKLTPAKNAVLQHATRHQGEGPYIPAPPRNSQPGLFQVLRRLSATSVGLVPAGKGNNHGLVERRVLNVDRQRQRCPITGLNQSRLRRVAFCVDVEIAPMPKYADSENCAGESRSAVNKTCIRKASEKAEGDALKSSTQCIEGSGETKSTGETAVKEGEEKKDMAENEPEKETITDSQETVEPSAEKTAADAKKKERKKKSEDERKARKEQKRRQAQDNGSIPLEIYAPSDSSMSGPGSPSHAPKMQATPTTNPVRIYRRCCQLRETPILRKITEQLLNPANCGQNGMVHKLDLTGYWMQLADLITLGDYLAVVPVGEVILENCGLTDEGIRVILAGLLAVRKPEPKRKKSTSADGSISPGGAVERLVLKNNKIGPEGWKCICMFIYFCRTIMALDVSGIHLPKSPSGPNPKMNGARAPLDICPLLARCLTERLSVGTLTLLNMSQTGLSTDQLGSLMHAVIKSGIRRLGLAHNAIDAQGMEHVTRFLSCDTCEGLDLGGNDLGDHVGMIADAIPDGHPMYALSLAECNLVPSSLCKLFSKLVKLRSFKFIDLSHNPELFRSNPSAVSVLRRYLPKLPHLKRIHLSSCAMTSEQVIAIAEIIPEISELAHISFLENPALVELTDAKTEEKKEEAVAMFASLLAAAKISTSLVAVEVEAPSEQSGELVKAMAHHVIAYCLRNMERLPLSELAAATMARTEEASRNQWQTVPDILQHLVGKDYTKYNDTEPEIECAPDDDYVIGGTGVVKALAACLENNHDDSGRQSGEFIRDVENGITHQRPRGPPGGKAKETSKALLSSARKIRRRLQPAILRAKASPKSDEHAYHRLLFLDNTLTGIIKRFEDEFPDTRISIDSATTATSSDTSSEKLLGTSLSSADVDMFSHGGLSDGDDDADLRIKARLARPDSALSITSKQLANEEGHVFRAGHKFRAGIIRPEYYEVLLSGVDMVAANPHHVQMLHQMLEELHDEPLLAEARDHGVVVVFKRHRDKILRLMREADPEHWDRFVESQEMARANINKVCEHAGPTTGEVEGAAPPAGKVALPPGTETVPALE